MMAFKKVLGYYLGYSIDNNQFRFYANIEGVGALEFFPAPEEFGALADMFRNEAKTVGIFYDDQNNSFGTNQLMLPDPGIS
jgi:hypothetical protein